MISIPFVLQTPRLSSLLAIHLRQQIKAKVKTGGNAFPTREQEQIGLRHHQTNPSRNQSRTPRITKKQKVKMTPGPMLHDKGNKGMHAGYRDKEEKKERLNPLNSFILPINTTQ